MVREDQVACTGLNITYRVVRAWRTWRHRMSAAHTWMTRETSRTLRMIHRKPEYGR